MANGRALLTGRPARPRHRRGGGAVWPGVLSAVIALALGIGGAFAVRVGTAAAASCPGPQNTRLCNGTVSPASGTTSTTFTFSVTYQDAYSGGPRTPYFVRVAI